ncbi:hypothetical protein P7K49_003757 [Saguinus oedipus]|uniref:Nucleotide exchange factor SIL1 n=1 Tax=Saguinus oedipus TaxID=9490 RepID=A0ABQ9W655_SAGOE|nr:hypothetical protein P7K49_003757 [Saguinus oedipus]
MLLPQQPQSPGGGHRRGSPTEAAGNPGHGAATHSKEEGVFPRPSSCPAPGTPVGLKGKGPCSGCACHLGGLSIICWVEWGRGHTQLKQVLFALCSLLRHFPYAQRQFLKLGGLQVLRSLVQEKGTEVLAVRVITLLYDLVTEKKLQISSFLEQQAAMWCSDPVNKAWAQFMFWEWASGLGEGHADWVCNSQHRLASAPQASSIKATSLEGHPRLCVFWAPSWPSGPMPIHQNNLTFFKHKAAQACSGPCVWMALSPIHLGDSHHPEDSGPHQSPLCSSLRQQQSVLRGLVAVVMVVMVEMAMLAWLMFVEGHA